MKIKLYVDDVLKEEYVEDGFVAFLGTKKMSVINLLSGTDIILPYVDKKILFPNGVLYTIRISTSPAFLEACNMMKQFKGLFVEICDDNARLIIEY